MWPFKKSLPQIPYSALIDSNGILLALSNNSAVIIFLSEATADTFVVHNINYLRPEEQFTPIYARPEHYPKWTWSLTDMRLSYTRPELLTEAARKRSRLAVAKGKVIANVMRNLTIARYPVSTGILFQESVYLAKKMQAEAFKNAGYPEKDAAAYPYVAQYADFEHISSRTAADDILFKAKLDDETLLKTEMLRLHYFDKVRKAEDPKELPNISEEFMHDYYIM